MLRVYIQYGDGRTSTDPSAANLTAALRDPAGKLWLDLECPDEQERRVLVDVFRFHPLAVQESAAYSQRPRVEIYPADDGRPPYLYMVVHGPDLQTFRENLRTKELDIFMTERLLVTMHDEPMKSIADVRQRCDTDPAVVLGHGIDVLLYHLMDRIAQNYEPILDYLEDALDSLEDDALNNPRPEVLTRIAVKKRELLNLRRIVAPQREVIAQLARGEVPFIRESTLVYVRDVQDHLIRVVEMVELYRDLVLGSRDIYLSSVSNNLNQVMKALTIISVIGLPLSVITGFFGMNFDALPGIHDVKAFWVAVALMLGSIAGMLYVFHRKRWI